MHNPFGRTVEQMQEALGSGTNRPVQHAGFLPVRRIEDIPGYIGLFLRPADTDIDPHEITMPQSVHDGCDALVPRTAAAALESAHAGLQIEGVTDKDQSIRPDRVFPDDTRYRVPRPVHIGQGFRERDPVSPVYSRSGGVIREPSLSEGYTRYVRQDIHRFETDIMAGPGIIPSGIPETQNEKVRVTLHYPPRFLRPGLLPLPFLPLLLHSLHRLSLDTFHKG